MNSGVLLVGLLGLGAYVYYTQVINPIGQVINAIGQVSNTTQPSNGIAEYYIKNPTPAKNEFKIVKEAPSVPSKNTVTPLTPAGDSHNAPQIVSVGPGKHFPNLHLITAGPRYKL